MTVKDFVKWIYPQARKMGEINPVFVTAQAALESGWGKSAIGYDYGIFQPAGCRFQGSGKSAASGQAFGKTLQIYS